MGGHVRQGSVGGEAAFTIGHEFGHYILHRQSIKLIRATSSVYCDEEAITQRDGVGIEKEADIFAADLLMPFHDFRVQLRPKLLPILKF